MIRTRFAPSPTGDLHLGGVRTALYSWAYAKKYGGEFVLRIEDTDIARSSAAYVSRILESLSWLGLEHDIGPYYQSHRTGRYREAIQQLLDSGHAYYCYASQAELEALRAKQLAAGNKPRYDRRWRDSKKTPPRGIPPVVRFKNPYDGNVVVDDEVRGCVLFNNKELDDLIIARADGTPTYNFCVVVDDIDMEITHVIRGDDHLNNTPRQMNIIRALGNAPPKYAHIPMILGPDGQKLSKRHGAVSALYYRENGFLPEAMLNYLARLGWTYADGSQELFSMKQMAEHFDLADINAAPSRFDPKKLLWYNHHYMKTSDDERLVILVCRCIGREPDPADLPRLLDVVGALKSDSQSVRVMAEKISDFFNVSEVGMEKSIVPLDTETTQLLRDLERQLRTVDWRRDEIRTLINSYTREKNIELRDVAMPLRRILVGVRSTPSIDVLLTLLGKKFVMKRLKEIDKPSGMRMESQGIGLEA